MLLPRSSMWVSCLLMASALHLVHGIDIDHESTPPYEKQDLIDTASIAQSSLRITQPAELVGTLMWAQSPYSGPMFNVPEADAAAGNFDLSFRIVIPHSNDDILACDPFQPFNDEGEALAGAIVMAQRGGDCAFAPKIDHVVGANAAAIALQNGVGRVGLVRVGVNTHVPTPIMFWTLKDGAIIRGYLLRRRAYLKARAQDPNYVSPDGKDYSLPVMGTVVGTGPIKSSELTALKSIARTMQVNALLSDFSTLRDWKELLTSDLDPCLNRIVGLWCERGLVQSVYLKQLALTGTIDPAWGALTDMKYLTLDSNTPDSVGLEGPVPSAICAMTGLVCIQIEGNALTSLPECFGMDLPKLHVINLNRNVLANLPTSVTGWSNVVWLTVGVNQLTALPAGLSTLTKLDSFEVNLNPKLAIDVATLNFATWYQASQINMASCAMTGTFVSNAFDGMNTLTTLDVNHNQLSGALPTFSGCTQFASLDISYNSFVGALPQFINVTSLVTLTMDHNQFTGALPSSWAALSNLETVILDHNELSGPLSPMINMAGLKKASFKNNKLVTSDPSGDVGATLHTWVGPSLVELYLDHNLIEGKWGTGFLKNTPSFTKLSMPYNKLKNVADDIFGTSITYFDFSYNELTGGIPADINEAGQALVTDFKIEGNPDLTPAWPLPEWLEFATPISYIPSPDGLYECMVLSSPTSRAFKIDIDPHFTEYNGCRCAKGRFGKPPNCDIVPVSAVLSPYGRLASSNETALQASNPDLFASLLDAYDSQPNGAVSLVNGIRAITLPPAFTDDWYGQDRLTIGLSTYWSIDLSHIRLHTGSRLENSSFASINSSLVSPADVHQPVRAITVRLHISRKHFVGLQNLLVVSEGTRTQQGKVAVSLLGADWISKSVENSTFTRTAEYQQRYAASLARLEEPRLVEVQVLSNAATIYFSSRDSKDTHFVSTYSYDFACPAGLVLRVDPSSGSDRYACLYPIPALETYDLPVRFAVYFMVALAVAFILMNASVLALKWNAPIYRAASRLFVMMIMFFLLAMAVGAIQYAIEPDVHSSDPGVCIGRAWLSAMPMAGILAVLLVKTVSRMTRTSHARLPSNDLSLTRRCICRLCV
jgi:Leucine-rich repeat (LRR) protein